MAAALSPAMKQIDQLETIGEAALHQVIGGAGPDPSMSGKGDFMSFLGTGMNGPPASTQMGSGGTGGSLPPLM